MSTSPAELAHQTARHYIQSGQLAAAGPCFSEACRLAPDNTSYAFDLALWHERNGDLATALGHYRTLLIQAPQHLDAALNLAGGLLQVSCPQEALAVLRQLPRPAIDASADLSNTLGTALLRLNDGPAAITAFRQALHLAPDFPIAARNLATALLQSGQHAEALTHLHALSKAYPDNQEILLLLGRAELALGHPDQARPAFLALHRQGLDQPDLRLGLAGLSRHLLTPIVGRRLCLLPFAGAHARFIQHAFTSRRFTRRMGRSWAAPGTLAALAEQLDRHQAAPLASRTALEWIVTDRNSQQALGVAVLTDLLWANSRAEFALGFIEPATSLSPLALEAALLTLDAAFNHARLKKVLSFVYHDNPRAQENTLSLGFYQEGFVRDQMYDENEQQWLSLFMNAMLESDFRSNQRLARLSRKLLGRDITLDPLLTQAKAVCIDAM